MGVYIKCIFKMAMYQVLTSFFDLGKKLDKTDESLWQNLPQVLESTKIAINLHILLSTFETFDALVSTLEDLEIKHTLLQICTLYGINGLISNC